jgi:hypothetical protein
MVKHIERILDMGIREQRQMKTRLRCAELMFFLCLVLYPSFSGAEIYVEKLATGRIDWSNGVVEASGVGVPPGKIENQAQARTLATQQARLLAARNILKTLKMLRIDSDHLAKDMVLKHDSFNDQLKNLVYRAAATETFFLEQSKVKTTITVVIRGKLADMLLPGSIREIEHIKGEMPDKKADSPKPLEKKAFTGLVIDCRGLKVIPALVPRLMDEEGDEIYGPAVVTRKDALRKGMAGYEKKIDDALRDPRIGTNPLKVTAVRASGRNPCDIVISNADAARILEAPANLGFLRSAGVIIVLD